MLKLVEPSWERLPYWALDPSQLPRQLLGQLHMQLRQAPRYGIQPHQTGHTLPLHILTCISSNSTDTRLVEFAMNLTVQLAQLTGMLAAVSAAGVPVVITST